IGYRVVAEEDLRKLAASSHHEGVVADMLREEPQPLTGWLRDLGDGPQCALWLDGVGNPHNLGAVLRSAAHFGIAAILLPKHSTLALSGAAARVAEGGAEAVPFVRLGRDDNAIAQLHGAGFKLAATVVRGGESLFDTSLPPRLVYVLGAEGEGMDPTLAEASDLRLSIPGTAAVESLNVAAAASRTSRAPRAGAGPRRWPRQPTCPGPSPAPPPPGAPAPPPPPPSSPPNGPAPRGTRTSLPQLSADGHG